MTRVAAVAEVAVTRDAILRHAQALPAAPQVLGGLCELLEDVNTDLDQVTEQIRIDPALSARVLRLSNSVIFGGGITVASIDEAVTRIGFAEITRVVGAATVAGLVDRALPAYGIAAERLRESLLLHALASEALAQRTAFDPRSAYACGLLRGVGMMVLERVARGRVEGAACFDPEQFTTYAEWERLRFGVTSVEVTRMILDEWRFPEELVVALGQHAAPTDDALANVLNLAGGIVAANGLALRGEETLWLVTPEKIAAAGLDEAAWQDAGVQAASSFEQQKHALY